jgi:hypothetical protein
MPSRWARGGVLDRRGCFPSKRALQKQKGQYLMKTILLLNDESASRKPRLQNVAGSKVTQRPSEGTPGCNCDRWGHPFPDRALESQMAAPEDSNRNRAVDCGGSRDDYNKPAVDRE